MRAPLDEGLAGGDVDGAPQPVDRGEQRHVPVPDVAAPDQQREHQRLDHHGGLGHEEDAPLAEAVAERAPDRREEQDGRELQRVHEPELERRPRQLQHQPRLADALHPGADEGDELPTPEEPEVAMPEGAEHTPRLYTAARGAPRVSAGTSERLTWDAGRSVMRYSAA